MNEPIVYLGERGFLKRYAPIRCNKSSGSRAASWPHLACARSSCWHLSNLAVEHAETGSTSRG